MVSGNLVSILSGLGLHERADTRLGKGSSGGIERLWLRILAKLPRGGVDAKDAAGGGVRGVAARAALGLSEIA